MLDLQVCCWPTDRQTEGWTEKSVSGKAKTLDKRVAAILPARAWPGGGGQNQIVTSIGLRIKSTLAHCLKVR